LKNRIHATLMAFGHPCPVSDLFGVAGRRLLDHLELPEPWADDVTAALRLIEVLDGEIDDCEAALRRHGATHRCVPTLMTAPGIGPVLGYTIAAEIGDITRFATPKKLVGYTGLCPSVDQSGGHDEVVSSRFAEGQQVAERGEDILAACAGGLSDLVECEVAVHQPRAG
jgi:transposase